MLQRRSNLLTLGLIGPAFLGTIPLQVEEGFLAQWWWTIICAVSLILVLLLVLVARLAAADAPPIEELTPPAEALASPQTPVVLPREAAAVKTETEAEAPGSSVEAAEPEAVAESEAAPEPEAAAPDDFKRIEGVGPKIASLLNEAGIITFAQLAATDTTKIQAILDAAGPRYRIADPQTWPEQARLAAAGDWDALSTLQDNLKGGRQAEDAE